MVYWCAAATAGLRPPYSFKAGKPGCGDLCPPKAKVISWDGVHFTHFGSGLAAKLAMSGEYSKPRVKLASLIHDGSKKTSDSRCASMPRVSHVVMAKNWR